MKLTYTNLPRKGKGIHGIANAKHNDRQFNYLKVPHIDPQRMSMNKYTSIYDSKEDGKMTFDEAESLFYKRHFQEQLDERNRKAAKGRHKTRKNTMDEFRKMRHFSPEETIIQLGNQFDQPEDKDILKQLVIELQRIYKKIAGRNLIVLNMAYHADEVTPHVHLRKIWVYYETVNGKEIMRIGQEKGLEQAGIPVYDPARPPGRYNNRRINFDHLVRNELFRLCKEKGLEIDTTPDRKNRKKMPIKQYKEYMRQQEAKMEKDKAHVNKR